MKRWHKILLGLIAIFLLCSLFLAINTRSTIPMPWTALLYNSGDNGLEHRTFAGLFPSREECIRFATRLLDQKEELKWQSCNDNCFANKFLCGKNCEGPEHFIGGAFVSEYKCEETYTGPN